MKKISSLYAGDIKVNIGSVFFRPKRISIKKRLDTVTDSFSFTVPARNENGLNFFIPNVFGLEVSVYVNDEFYVDGILINRRVSNNEITCECSTQGWQLGNSDIYIETEYNGNCIGDFILETCNANFFDTNHIILRNGLPPDIQKNGESYEALEATLYHAYKDVHNSLKEITYNIPGLIVSNIILNGALKEVIKKTKRVQFAIYDPFFLYQTNISDFQNPKDTQNNKIKSDYHQSVFEYIKSVTKNVNIFIKCIGKYQNIKDKIEKTRLFPSSITDNSDILCYVLLLYRPGIDYNLELYEDIAPVSSRTYDNTNQTQVYKYYTYQYMKDIGYVVDDNSSKRNCAEAIEEEYSGSENYSIYILRGQYVPENIMYRDGQKPDRKAIDELSKKDMYFSKVRYDSTCYLGNVKNIFVDDNVTEYGAARRLNYEINRIKAESYSIKAKVYGYTLDMDVSKVNYWERGGKNRFWDVNRTAIVKAPNIGIYEQKMIVGEMEMVYDSESGAYTNLTLISPLSYSAEELQYDINQEKYREERKRIEYQNEVAKNKKIDFSPAKSTYNPLKQIINPIGIVFDNISQAQKSIDEATKVEMELYDKNTKEQNMTVWEK